MSAARKGHEIQRREDEVQRVMKPGVYTSARPGDSPSGGTTAAVFPRTFDAGTEQWDKITQLKQQMVSDKKTATTPFGQLTFSDNDAYNLLKKEEAVKAAEFDSWFGSNYHVNDIATRRFAQEVNPDYYARREAQMVEKAKQALRIKLMMMRGPKNEEDLQIIYGLQSGEIVLADDWDKIGSELEGGLNQVNQNQRLKQDLSLSSRLFRNPVDQVANMTPYSATPFKVGGDAPPASVFTSNRSTLRNFMQ